MIDFLSYKSSYFFIILYNVWIDKLDPDSEKNIDRIWLWNNKNSEIK